MKVIETAAAPRHTGPVPQAVESGGWIFVSALFGNHPQTGQLPAEAGQEADQIFANLAAILSAAGAGLSDVVRVGIFMRDLQRDRPAFNEAWTRHFGEHRPARCAVEVKDFGRAGEGARYMLEVRNWIGPVLAWGGLALFCRGVTLCRGSRGCLRRRG